MPDLGDCRKSRFYQEARQDGIEEGEARGEARGETMMLHAIVRQMASKGFDVKQISDTLEIDIKSVKKILKAGSK